MEVGRKLLVFYKGENLWHEMILLAPGSAESLRTMMAERVRPGASVWWILSPDGDVYPMEINSPPLTAWLRCDDEGRPDRGTLRRSIGSSRLPPLSDSYIHRVPERSRRGSADVSHGPFSQWMRTSSPECPRGAFARPDEP